MTAIGAFISGCSGPVLSTAEQDFFARTNPWGLILFKRNCETPEQLKTLTSAFRAAVGRADEPLVHGIGTDRRRQGTCDRRDRAIEIELTDD